MFHTYLTHFFPTGKRSPPFKQKGQDLYNHLLFQDEAIVFFLSFTKQDFRLAFKKGFRKRGGHIRHLRVPDRKAILLDQAASLTLGSNDLGIKKKVQKRASELRP